MGIAEVIPGVSGGTIAFITGIYETLIDCITSFDLDLLQLLRKGKFKAAWTKINGDFLVALVAGMVGGIVFGIFVITYLMHHYPEPLWGFFFGLVVASALLIGRQIGKWDITVLVAFLIGVSTAVGLAIITPTGGSLNPFYIFMCGVIAISAFILPGVSGSFMLLLLGMYTVIIPSLKSILVNGDLESIKIIGIFAIGCIVGITSFARLLSWLFDHYERQTLVLLTGFLVGSLYKIWPWRNVQLVMDKTTSIISTIGDKITYEALEIEQIKILKEVNALPSDYWMSSPKTVITLLAVVVGYGIVVLLEKSQQKEVK